MLSADIRSEDNMESSSILTAFAAQLPSTKLLHLDSKLVAMQLVPRLRQLAIKLAPGRQKPRHASLLSASDKSCCKEHNPAVGTPVVQQRLLNTTAGPLASIRHRNTDLQSFKKSIINEEIEFIDSNPITLI
jgi:hypothetical protein